LQYPSLQGCYLALLTLFARNKFFLAIFGLKNGPGNPASFFYQKKAKALKANYQFIPGI